MSETGPIIGLFGATIWGNRGAEAMLVTTIGKIRETHPNAKFKIFSYYPSVDQKLCNDPEIEILNYTPLNLALVTTPLALLHLSLNREVQAMKKCDLILDVSGISYCDGREKFLLYNVFTLLPPLFLGKPVIKMSQALGSFNSFLNRFISKIFLPKYKKIYARGEITKQCLDQLGIKNTVKLSSDIAFLYEPKYSLSSENDQLTNELIEQIKNSAKKIAAIIPSALVDNQNSDYLDKIIHLIKFLKDNGYLVLLVPNATKEKTAKPRNNDVYTIRRIKEYFANDTQLIAADFDINTKNIKNLLQQAKVVITSRFHGMIASLSLVKPTMVIGWSHKYQEILELFEQEKYAFLHSEEKEVLAKNLKSLIDDQELNTQKIKGKLERARGLAEKQFQELF